MLQLSAPIRSQDLNSSITHLNNVVYNYFADIFGHVEKIPDKELVNKYKDQSVYLMSTQFYVFFSKG